MTEEDQGERWEHLLPVTSDGENLQGQGGEAGANWSLIQGNPRPLAGAQVRAEGLGHQEGSLAAKQKVQS